MEENIVKMDTDIFKSITDDIMLNGESCMLDKEIINCLNNMTCTDIGNKLGENLALLCDSSFKHMNHAGTSLPTALDKLRQSIINIDKAASEAIKMLE